MRLTVEKDDGTTEVFQNVTDLYIAYRQTERGADFETPAIVMRTVTRSHSWSTDFRELVKEVQQSLFEMQDHLRGLRHGGTS